MTHTFTGNEIELANGQPFDPANPDHRAITLEAVARSLSKNARYGGHDTTEYGYSIAEHAVLVSLKLERLGAAPQIVMAGLHHDDAEALNGVGDPQRPAKHLLGTEFRARERKIDRAVWRALAWPDKGREPLWRTEDFTDPLLRRVDHEWAIAFEAARIMPSGGDGWGIWTRESGMHPIPDHDEDRLWCWTAPEAYAAYVGRHYELVGRALRTATAA